MLYLLFSQENSQHLPKFLDIINNVTQQQNLTLTKQVFSIFKSLVENWAGYGAESVPGFNQFVFEKIAKACFAVPLHQNFNPRDATANNVRFKIRIVYFYDFLSALICQMYQVLNEIVNVQLAIVKKCNSQYVSYLNTKFLPSLRFPKTDIEMFIRMLLSNNKVLFRNHFKRLVGSKTTT